MMIKIVIVCNLPSKIVLMTHILVRRFNSEATGLQCNSNCAEQINSILQPNFLLESLTIVLQRKVRRTWITYVVKIVTGINRNLGKPSVLPDLSSAFATPIIGTANSARPHVIRAGA